MKGDTTIGMSKREQSFPHEAGKEELSLGRWHTAIPKTVEPSRKRERGESHTRRPIVPVTTPPALEASVSSTSTGGSTENLSMASGECQSSACSHHATASAVEAALAKVRGAKSFGSLTMTSRGPLNEEAVLRAIVDDYLGYVPPNTHFFSRMHTFYTPQGMLSMNMFLNAQVVTRLHTMCTRLSRTRTRVPSVWSASGLV